VIIIKESIDVYLYASKEQHNLTKEEKKVLRGLFKNIRNDIEILQEQEDYLQGMNSLIGRLEQLHNYVEQNIPKRRKPIEGYKELTRALDEIHELIPKLEKMMYHLKDERHKQREVAQAILDREWKSIDVLKRLIKKSEEVIHKAAKVMI
jgi:hypothetical protein